VLLTVLSAPLPLADDEADALALALALALLLLLPLLWLRALIAMTWPPCMFAGAVLELVPCAADLYAARVLAPDDAWLTTMDMPPWQWPGVEQNNHMGSVLFTITWKTSLVDG